MLRRAAKGLEEHAGHTVARHVGHQTWCTLGPKGHWQWAQVVARQLELQYIRPLLSIRRNIEIEQDRVPAAARPRCERDVGRRGAGPLHHKTHPSLGQSVKQPDFVFCINNRLAS